MAHSQYFDTHCASLFIKVLVLDGLFKKFIKYQAKRKTDAMIAGTPNSTTL